METLYSLSLSLPTPSSAWAIYLAFAWNLLCPTSVNFKTNDNSISSACDSITDWNLRYCHNTLQCYKYLESPLYWVLADLLCRGRDRNIFGGCGPNSLNYSSVLFSMNTDRQSGSSCISVKLYLQTQVAGQTWPVGRSVLTSTLRFMSTSICFTTTGNCYLMCPLSSTYILLCYKFLISEF